MEQQNKRIFLERLLDVFEKDKITGKIELDLKSGQLMGGRQITSF